MEQIELGLHSVHANTKFKQEPDSVDCSGTSPIMSNCAVEQQRQQSDQITPITIDADKYDELCVSSTLEDIVKVSLFVSCKVIIIIIYSL